MAFERMNDDLQIISKLGDIPGADDGLSAQELKALFDKASLLLQGFINNKLIPEIEKQNVGLPIGGGTMQGSINMKGHSLYGLDDPTADDEAATRKFVETYVAENAAMELPLGVEYGGTGATNAEDARKNLGINDTHNYLDNSDFTQFIAQAGIGGKHGNQAYAGDRWILDSGTVTGEANENGNGFSNIQLNGTIRQIVGNPPAVGSVFVEMVSGTATATYQNGEVIITSNGGVIRNVLLCEGEYTEDNKPKYQPKGYGAELAECLRYFRRYQTVFVGGMSYNPGNGYRFGFSLSYDPMRIKPPTITGKVVNYYGTGKSFEFDQKAESLAVFCISSDSSKSTYAGMYIDIEISADI